MSGKTIGDERKKQITRRQNEAKAAARRYIDDVTFQVAKDSRDRLRAGQRDLRDHFTAQADQLKRTLLEAQQATERAVKASRAEREARLTQITKELEQLELVRKQARALLPARGDEGTGNRAARAGRMSELASAMSVTATGVSADRAKRGSAMTALADAARRVLLLAIDAHRHQPADGAVAARPAATGSTSRCGSRSRARSRRASRRCSTLWSGNRSHRPTPASAPGSSPGTATGATPRIVLHPARGTPRPLPVSRHDGALVIDLGAASPPRSSTGWWSTGPRRACGPPP